MALIENEIPSGSIDGVNKVFNVAYTIFQIDSVWVDGEIVFNTAYTYLDKTITLDEAPTVDIYIDYFDSLVLPPAQTPTYAQEFTVNEYKTALMNEFGLDEDNDNEGTSAESILGYIDDANREFIQHRAWSFRLKHRTEFKMPGTKVAIAFGSTSTQIILDDTSNFASTGTVFIDGDIIPYSNNNTGTNTLTVSDVDRDHDVGELVWYLHPVPADYNKISDIWIGDTPIFPEDSRNTKQPTPYKFWEIALNEPNGRLSKYLMYWYTSSGKEKMYMKYGSLATNLMLNPDTTYMEVPAPYRDYVKESVFSRIYKHLEDYTSMQVADKKAKEILLAAAVYDSKKHMSNRVPLRTKWDNPGNMLYRNSNMRITR